MRVCGRSSRVRVNNRRLTCFFLYWCFSISTISRFITIGNTQFKKWCGRYVEEFADPNSMVGYTLLVDYYSFPEERLEFGENLFQVHANGVSENTNPAFPDITVQLPSRHKLNRHFC